MLKKQSLRNHFWKGPIRAMTKSPYLSMINIDPIDIWLGGLRINTVTQDSLDAGYADSDTKCQP